MYLANQKKVLRKHYKDIRAKIDPFVAKKIFNQTRQTLLSYSSNQTKGNYIGIYWPINGEVDLLQLKSTLSIPLALPAIKEKGLITYHPWKSSALEKDFFGIPAPLNEPALSPEEMSILLIPALAIDNEGYRLGQGGGYYDRLMKDAKWRSIPSLIVLPEACISKEPLPRESWDIPFNGRITEKGMTRITKSKILFDADYS